MRFKKGLKVRDIAGESVVIMQGEGHSDMTKVITLNSSSLYLWESLAGKEITSEDVGSLLIGTYGISADTAAKDSAVWVEQLKSCGAVE